MSNYAHPDTLVSTAWAVDHLNDPGVKFIEVDVDTAAYGIKMALKKTLATEDYSITFQLKPRKDGPRRGGLFSGLFGR